MKKLLLVLFSLVLVIIPFITRISNDSSETDAAKLHRHSKYTVVIDAGHGGKDAGTIGIDGTMEKGINLSIALTLYDYLRVCGIDAVLVRNGDFEIYGEREIRDHSDLYNRLDFVNSIENSMLISIHQNHFENEREWGCQIWYSPNDESSKVIADKALSSVKELLQPTNQRENKVSGSDYYILYKASVPSIMIECGFMSNAKENELLKTPDYQKNFAFAVTAGICGEV